MLQDPRRRALIQILLVLLTAVTLLMSGAELRTGQSALAQLDLAGWLAGLPYALALFSFITVHEFGHFLTARYHRVRTTWPFYLPLYLPGFFNIGTLGAVIMLREQPWSTRKYFDIGIAGPLAGFVVSIGLLIYGFSHLPDPDAYILELHPEYVEQFGGVPDVDTMRAFQAEEGFPSLWIGTNLLYEFFARVIPADPGRVPPPFEMMHYPFLFTGFLTLFFTALNLLPVGQLDGGHVIYGMFGRQRAGVVARITLGVLLLVGGTGLVDWQQPGPSTIFAWLLYLPLLYYVSKPVLRLHRTQDRLLAVLGFCVLQGLLKLGFPAWNPQGLWLIYSLMLVRVVKLDHPPAYYEARVSPSRQALGWLAILIFVLSITPAPLTLEGMPPADWRAEWQELLGWLWG
ncbi:MAG: site-2 protease family protein [Bacteroidetes bacterium]|nr:MAG: site-2 protease family protein [Bacteroidota bacterium]